MKKIEMSPLRAPKGLFEKTDPFLMSAGTTVHDIPLDKLVPFSRHPFKLYEGQKLDDLVESVKANGVMIPIIVRQSVSDIDTETSYEILSGHNRVNAARLAGLETIHAIIKDNLGDDEAMLIVTTTNLIQRQFVEMSHSERAAVLSAHHAAIKQQGRRHDLVKEIENMLNTSHGAENSTSSPLGNLTSMDKTGAEYALSKNTIARYLRVNMLTDGLKESLDFGKFGMRAAVAVSYLSEETQHQLMDVLTSVPYELSTKKAEVLRAAAQTRPLTRTDIENILAGTPKTQPPAFRLKPKLVWKYFNGKTVGEMESMIVAALDLYFSAQRKNDG